jgi:hypothetical protein
MACGVVVQEHQAHLLTGRKTTASDQIPSGGVVRTFKHQMIFGLQLEINRSHGLIIGIIEPVVKGHGLFGAMAQMTETNSLTEVMRVRQASKYGYSLLWQDLEINSNVLKIKIIKLLYCIQQNGLEIPTMYQSNCTYNINLP